MHLRLRRRQDADRLRHLQKPTLAHRDGMARSQARREDRQAVRPYVASDSFIGELVGEAIELPRIPPLSRTPDGAIDFSDFAEGEDEGE